MALYFTTTEAKKLLSAFKDAIDQGHVKTWSYDKDGDFTHTADQWVNKAWLKPSLELDRLCLYIVPPESGKISKEVYGIYHGRFIETILVHCDTLFQNGIATAQPTGEDKVKGSKA